MPGDGGEALDDALLAWLRAGLEQIEKAVHADMGRSVQGLEVHYTSPAEAWWSLPVLHVRVSSGATWDIVPSIGAERRRELFASLTRAARSDGSEAGARYVARLKRVVRRVERQHFDTFPRRRDLSMGLVEIRPPEAAKAPRVHVPELVAVDDTTVLSAHSDGRLVCWSASGASPREVAGPGLHAVTRLACGRDGRVVARTNTQRGLATAPLRVVHVESGAVDLIDSGHVPGGIADFAVSQGRVLSAGATDGTVRIWDLGAGTSRPLEGTHWGGVGQLRTLRDGRVVSLGRSDNTVRLWDIDTRCSDEVLENGSYGATMLAEGPPAHVLVSISKRLVAWDLERAVVRELGSLPWLIAVGTLPDQRVLALDCVRGVHVIDLASGTTETLHVSHPFSYSASVLSGGRVVGPAHSGFLLWDVETQRVRDELPLRLTTEPPCLALSDELIAAADAAGHVHFIEVASAATMRSGTGRFLRARA